MSAPGGANAPAAITTTISRPVIKRCPHRDETDAGTLTITFQGEAPELHDLAKQIDDLSNRAVTHEAFTRSVAVLLTLAGHVVSVVTEWSTGSWMVEVLSNGRTVRDLSQVGRKGGDARR